MLWPTNASHHSDLADQVQGCLALQLHMVFFTWLLMLLLLLPPPVTAAAVVAQAQGDVL